MPTRTIWLIALLGVAALLVVTLPVAAMGCVEAPAADRGCDEADCSPAAEANDTEQPIDEDCCPSGCQGCFLPCCSGFPSLHTSSAILLVNLSSRSAGSTDDEEFSPAHVTNVYHPPRR